MQVHMHRVVMPEWMCAGETAQAEDIKNMAAKKLQRQGRSDLSGWYTEVLDRLSVELVREDDTPPRRSCLRGSERHYLASLDPWPPWSMAVVRCRRSFAREK